MNSSYYRFTLNLQSNVSQISLPVRQYDTSRGFCISFADGASPYTIKDGCRAVLTAKKADGNVLLNDCVIEKNTVVRYDFSEQTTSCAGIVNCEIRLYGVNGKLIASPKFILVVDDRVTYDDDFPISESDISSIDNILLVETERVNAEAERVTAEALRVEAEKARVTAEEERVAAEASRVLAEADRESAEGERAEEFEAMKVELKEKVDSGYFTGPQGPQGEQGPQGAQGEQGKPFSIAKIYGSVDAMNAGYATDGVAIGGFVVIDTGNVEDEDNAKLFIKGASGYSYLTDMSGAAGIQGPQGPQGPQGAQGPQGPQGDSADDIDVIVEQVVGVLAKANEGVYLGTWYLREPCDLSMFEEYASAGRSEYFKFSFSVYINGSKETKYYSGMYVQYGAAVNNPILRYIKEDGSESIAYRSKYGVFAANSYQTVTLHSEPPDEIKAFLDANGVYMGNTDASVTALGVRMKDLEEKIASIEAGAEGVSF